MTQISILLLVIVFSLLLIRHGHIHRRISIVLFGIVLLFALPLSMYKQSDGFTVDDIITSNYVNTVKTYIGKETTSEENKITNVVNEDNSSINVIDDVKKIDFKSIGEIGNKLSKIGSDLKKVKKSTSKENATAKEQIGIVKKIGGAIEDVSDFFEFIRGSNVAAVDFNVEDEVLVIGSNYSNDKSTSLELHVIDVGQGDSMLIKKGELEILIDAGPNEEGINVVKYLKGNFVKEIDLVISTHPHEDHIGGMDVVLDNIPVKRIIDSGDSLDTKTYRDYMSAIAKSGAELIYDNNLVYDYGDVKVQIIELGDNHKNTNENSVVAVISYNGKNILAAGDLEEDLEDELVQILKAKNITIDLYKASHHGSKTSNSSQLLDYIKPEVVVISAGEDNKYKHPNKDAMQNFLNNTDRVYSTHKSGNLKFIIEDEIVESKGYYKLLITDSNDFR